jgi:hypothetical protein
VTVEKDGLKVFIEKDANVALAAAIMDFSEQRGFVLNGMEEHSCEDGSCEDGSCEDGSCEDGSCDECDECDE